MIRCGVLRCSRLRFRGKLLLHLQRNGIDIHPVVFGCFLQNHAGIGLSLCRDARGKLFRFQAHQFRHTVGTRMINLGVPHHIIQRYLGHKGPEMTSRYAHIHDTTMKDKLSEYLKGTLIDVTDKVVPEDGMNDSADLQWFTRSVLAQALTNGYCAIPIVAGPCPHPNACLNCAHFRTDATFHEVHRAELHETERVIAKAEANGRARQSEMNARKRTSLINIVTALEASHG